MFCNQCEQTAGSAGCTVSGACGKRPDAAALQDLVLQEMIALSLWADAGRRLGIVDDQADAYAMKALFHTVTNVDFDPASLDQVVRDLYAHRVGVAADVAAAGGSPRRQDRALAFVPAETPAELLRQARLAGHFSQRGGGIDVRSLQQLTIYGVKGIAAYADHARILGQTDPEVAGFIYKAFASLADNSLLVDEWTALALEAGKINLRAMELLDTANTGAYGHPVPTEVTLGHRPGKAILVSGHDLKDLADLLEQTAGMGIDVYTHGEMLPAHGYPELNRHPHLYGHYGTAWQNQHTEFAEFPGAILMTTNCVQSPKPEYAENIFTTGNVAWPGATHVAPGDFGVVIDRAMELEGFEDEPEADTVMTGFGHNAVIGLAPQLIEAVNSGAIRRFILVGGCDGAKPGRSYYTELVESAPDDTVILTLACGKFRFFDRKMGDIDGIPRLMDLGQCNDSYSAIRIALALADALGVGVNELPLSIVMSWFEQKAVAMLLTFLHLGIENILLGPTLPVTLSPNVLRTLSSTYNLREINEYPYIDLATILGPEPARSSETGADQSRETSSVAD